jgi:hypothetical protein
MPRTLIFLSARTTASPVFVSPPSSGVSEHLDAAHEEDIPLRFRSLDYVLESTTPPGPVERVLAEQLLLASKSEPAMFEEA